MTFRERDGETLFSYVWSKAKGERVRYPGANGDAHLAVQALGGRSGSSHGFGLGS